MCHVAQLVLQARVGDKFIALDEIYNDKDRHAMAVYRDEDPVYTGRFFGVSGGQRNDRYYQSVYSRVFITIDRHSMSVFVALM